MLPADVGAAPAAATRYQSTSSTPPAARRERQASAADPFGELVDQYADEAEPAAAPTQRNARPAARQATTAPPQAQMPVADAPAVGIAMPGVKSQPRPADVAPPVVAVPAAEDASRTDLVVPQMPTVFDVPLPLPVATSGTGTGTDLTVAVTVTGGGGTPMAAMPVLSQHWPPPVAAAAGTPFAAPPADAPRLAPTEAVAPSATAPAPPLVEFHLPEGMPPEAASPEVLAALRAVRTTNPSGSPDLGDAVSAAASNLAARPVQAPGPTPPSGPREVAMAAVREALAQSVDGNRPVSTPSTLTQSEPQSVQQSVQQSGQVPVPAAPGRMATPVLNDAAVQAPPSDVPIAALSPDAPQTSEPERPALGAAVTPEQVSTDAASIRTPRSARQASAQPQIRMPNSAVTQGGPAEENVQALPSRKATHDDVPAPVARPTARAAQAIAAFHAAATIGATTTPAAVNAAVMSAGVASTPLLDAELPTQLIHAIRVQCDQGSGEARIRLNPGFLGGVTVGVQIDGSSVTASLQAASAEVREWMRTNESMLRQALADQGLQLDRLVIVEEDAPTSTDDEAAGPRDEREQQAPRRQRRTADQGTFELVF